MRSPAFDPQRMLAWASPAQHGLREALRWGSHHSGLPVVVVAALALVLSYRLAKRAARLAVEVVVATTLLLVATRLGWIAW
jgi:hypothetical protein